MIFRMDILNKTPLRKGFYLKHIAGKPQKVYGRERYVLLFTLKNNLIYCVSACNEKKQIKNPDILYTKSLLTVCTRILKSVRYK